MHRKTPTQELIDVLKQPPKIGFIDTNSLAYKEAKKFSELKSLADIVNSKEFEYDMLLRKMSEPQKYD